MKKINTATLAVVVTLLLSVMLSGCSGTAERKYGLRPEEVVKVAFESARDKKFNQAAAYIAPNALKDKDANQLAQLLTGLSAKDLSSSNLLSVKPVSQQGRFAAVIATFHQENTLKVSMKAVGLEEIEGEWYIVPNDRIVTNAKYRLLAELMQVGK